MKTIGRKVTIATLPSSAFWQWTGQGFIWTNISFVEQSELFPLVFWDSYIRWDWAQDYRLFADVNQFTHI